MKTLFLLCALVITNLGMKIGGSNPSPCQTRKGLTVVSTGCGDGEAVISSSPLILTCALALPASNYRVDLTEDQKVFIEEYERLKRFIEDTHPGAEVKIQDRLPRPGQIHDNLGWERLPFRWRNKDIYIKRKPVRDLRAA